MSSCQTVRYSNGGLRTRLKKPKCPKYPVFEWSAKLCDLIIWIPDTHTVGFSDESSIQVFGIQMVTVVKATINQNKLIIFIFEGALVVPGA